MNLIRIIVSMSIFLLFVLIANFMWQTIQKKDTASAIGFGFMELVYVASIFLIWS